ncbi:sensor histidine kinase [Amycolatopsis ultiminotia]|uniref:Sensor histidine kinase n=1 Tax=Amycolatopsis ultiminotia TaxID=543629 RepID=A0ABP6X7G7_9PSEU
MVPRTQTRPRRAGTGKSRFSLGDRASWWDDPALGTDRGPNKIRWPVFGFVFLLPYLIPATQGLLEDRGPLVWRVLIGLLAYAYAACYLAFPFAFGASRRVKLWFGCSMLALGLLATLAFGMSSYILLYATATLAFIFPPAWAAILDGGALGLVTLVLYSDGRLADSGGDLVTVVSVTAAMFFMANLIRAIRRLQLANEEIATLAVANERERVARDLHDLLGHSLTTITVKAGVARRVLEASADIPRAVAEIREVEGLTRTALSDVRATVSEYRTVSLPAEIAGARAALRAADVEAELPSAADNVRAELQATFGYVLREAVTNVLRHSGAKRVRVRLGRDWLEVEDDGSAGVQAEPGNGLRGLSERVASVGGTFVARPRSGGGWTVRAEVPEPEPDGAAAVLPARPAGGLA